MEKNKATPEKFCIRCGYTPIAGEFTIGCRVQNWEKGGKL